MGATRSIGPERSAQRWTMDFRLEQDPKPRSMIAISILTDSIVDWILHPSTKQMQFPTSNKPSSPPQRPPPAHARHIPENYEPQKRSSQEIPTPRQGQSDYTCGDSTTVPPQHLSPEPVPRTQKKSEPRRVNGKLLPEAFCSPA